jgi:acyl-CoA reductase-like NAD-dependent aldehyde dehydrogenase
MTTTADTSLATSIAIRLESFDPATREVVGSVPLTAITEIGPIVARARAAQPAWEALGFERRAALLREGYRAFEEKADELGRLITREMGKPIAQATGEARSLARGIEAELREIGEALAPEALEDDQHVSVIHHDPFGVCAAITPWNFPLSMPHTMVLPALAAGNTVVFKPSEETPLCGQAYADALNAVLPPDVLVVVHGAEAQGRALVEAEVDMIAFTGSREAGKQILGAASAGLKRVVLELGGKDPLIVLDDADLEKAARFTAMNCFRNAGQVCVSTERIFVDAKVAERFERLLAEETAKVKVGPGIEQDSEIGPMVNARQRDHVIAHIEDALAHGARLVAGGPQPDGNFLAPTLLTGVTDDMRIAREETFGPVACVSRFDTDDEAIARANDTPYGLGAVVFGGAPGRVRAVARRLKAGMIGINKSVGGVSGTPWVGARESGYGFHGSRDGHRQFTQVRVLTEPKSA